MPSVATSPGRSTFPAPDRVVVTSSPAWALVSFVMEDVPWCDWLYREFDGERVPRPLLGRPSRHGLPYPERISVSPDPADAEQLCMYEETLRTAQHLIVIVSPHSGQSALLSEHMRIFRASGGEERIIALVVNGEPASPAAKPGTDADREWLPRWLAWRLEGNRFLEADRTEPLVIDARLGVSSLAEVRARVFAAMLEVSTNTLAELGFVTRATQSVQQLATAPPPPVPTPLPTPPPKIRIAPPEQPRAHARWPLVLCGLGVVAALVGLAMWPTPTILPQSTPYPASVVVMPVVEEVTSVAPAPRPPVIEIPANAVPAELAEELAFPVDPPPAPLLAAEPSAPIALVQPEDGKLKPQATVQVPAFDAEAAIRTQTLLVRRDRLVREADAQLRAGDTELAIETFERAVDVAHQYAQRTGWAHDATLELAIIHRRLGNIVGAANSSAEARPHFERARRVLAQMRAKGTLPREASRMLAEVEMAIRQTGRN